MDIADKARKLERRISRTIDAAVEELTGRSEPAPIEVVHAVLERAEHQMQEIGRGRRVFPFNRVRVHVVAAPRDKEARARFAAVLDGPPSLAERLRDRLRSGGCDVTDLSTEVVYARQPGAGWERAEFHVEFDRVPPTAVRSPPRASSPPVRLKLVVVNGTAERRAYVFDGGRIDIGRRAHVLDQRQRLIRTNHVAFAEDGPETNHSVSRRHAHIEFDADAGCYRLFDDRSAHGTSIVRGGRTIKVPAVRGTKLESGDEIALGQARLKVTLGGEDKQR